MWTGQILNLFGPLKSKIGETSDPKYYNEYIELYRKNKQNIENFMKVFLFTSPLNTRL